MTSKTFDIDKDKAKAKERKKAIATQEAERRVNLCKTLGNLVLIAKVVNERTAENFVGMMRWADAQGRINKALEEEWTQAGATFLKKPRPGDDGPNGDGSTGATTKPKAKAKPAGEPDGQADAGDADLLTRAAAE